MTEAAVQYYETKHSSSCLQKAGDDEPIFVVRAQDSSAPAVVQAWLIANPHISEQKRKSAINTMQAMRQWPKRKKAD